MSLAVHLKEKMVVPDVEKVVPKEPVEEKESEHEELSESSDVDSDDSTRVGDLL